MSKIIAERIQRDTGDILVVISDEEEIFRKKFFLELGDAPNIQKCTICSNDTGSRLYPHPALRVAVCFTCYNAYEDTVFIINKDGTDTLCRWCAKPADKYSCSKCTCIFCIDCLERNFGEAFVQSTIDDISNEWSCLICYPKQLWSLRAFCIRAMDCNKNSPTPSTSKQSSNVQDAKEESYQPSSPKSEIIISPKKKPLKPIEMSDDDELSVSQNSNAIVVENDKIQLSQNSDCTVQLSQNSSCSQNSELLSDNATNKTSECAAFKMFMDIKDLVDRFIDLFDKENKLFDKKAYTRENCVAYENVEKIVNKVHLFCEKAQKNLTCIDTSARGMFEHWSKKYHTSISDDGISSSQEESASLGCSPLSETTPTTNRAHGTGNSVSVSRGTNTSVATPSCSKNNTIVPEPSTSREQKSNKNKCKKQLSLCLKHRRKTSKKCVTKSAECKDNNSDAETSNNTSKEKQKICYSELKVHLVDVLKYSPKKSPVEQGISPKKETMKEINADSSDTESHSSFSQDTEILNQDGTSNINKKRRRKRKKKQIQIKEEIEDESNVEEVFDDTGSELNISGDENPVKLVQYLCERTGDFIQCYTNYDEESELHSMNPTVVQSTTSNSDDIVPIENEYISIDDLEKMNSVIGTFGNNNSVSERNVDVSEKVISEVIENATQELQTEVNEQAMNEDEVFANATLPLQTELGEETVAEDDVFANPTQQLQKNLGEETMTEDDVFTNVTQQLQTNLGGETVAEYDVITNATQQLQTNLGEETVAEDDVITNATQQLQTNLGEEPVVEDDVITNTTQQLQTNLGEETVAEDDVITNATQQLQTNLGEEPVVEDDVITNTAQQLQTNLGEETVAEDDVITNATQQLQTNLGEETVAEDDVFANPTQQLQTNHGEETMAEDDVITNPTQQLQKPESKTNENTIEDSSNQENMSINDNNLDDLTISEDDEHLAEVMRKITETLDTLEQNIIAMDKVEEELCNNNSEILNIVIANRKHNDNVEWDKNNEINSDRNENVESTNTDDSSKQNKTDSIEIDQESISNKDNITENDTNNVVVKDTDNNDNIFDHYDSTTEEEADNDDDDESEWKRKEAYMSLFSDSEDISTELDESSAEEYSDSSDGTVFKTEDDSAGYVQELNLQQELENICAAANSQPVENETIKTESENISDTGNSNPDDDSTAQHFLNDPKLLQKCSVIVHRVDFENCYGLVRVSDTDSYRLDSDKEDDEIRRLTNLETLKRRASSRLSSDSSNSSLKSKKRSKRSANESDESSSSDSNETLISLDDDDTADLPSNTAKSLSATDVSEALDDLLLSSDSEFENDIETNDSRVRNKSIASNNEETAKNTTTDENKTEEEPKSDDNCNSWRKDRLLTSNINLTDDSDATNDSTANTLLKEQEERSNENKSKEDGLDCDLDATSSDAGSETDDDCVFIDMGTKRRHDSDDDEPRLLKKGRRNIKEVMSDDLLQEETKLADKEEEARKERIAMKHQSLDLVLSQSSMSQNEVGLVLDVDEKRKEPMVSVHPVLTNILKKHQCDGIKFMWDVCFESVKELKTSAGAGCILAHCMGLGKTMQIVVLAHTLLTHPVTNVKHILVVCPLSTVFNWKNEFQMSMSKVENKIKVYDISPHSHKNLKARIFTVQQWRRSGGVLLIGYESYQTLIMDKKTNNMTTEMQAALVNPGPDLVVCDEGHMLKNDKTARFKSLINLKTKRRIILTGTPLQNNLTEYYYMVKMVKPHLLGTINEYANRFVNPIVNGQYENSSADDINLMRKRSHVLHKKLETTVQRFEVSELEPYLPEKYDYVLFLKLSPLQIKLYQKYLELVDKNKSLFKNFHALQNIWTHPALLQLKLNKKTQVKPKKIVTYDEDFVPELDPDSASDELIDKDWFKPDCPDDLMSNISHGPKMQILFSIINECQTIGDKLLVFSSSIAELDLIEYFLKDHTLTANKTWIHGSDYFRMDGTVAPEVRMKYCNAFNDKSNRRAMLFLVSHKVGGLGLNLVAANRVVLMDVSWNPAYDIQSVFRVYRFGQEQKCYIYRLVSMGTMEEVVHGRAVTKLAISGRVVDERQINRHFRSDDLQKMYQLNIETKDPPRPTVPYDRLLAKLWEMHNPVFYKFYDHESMLENLPHEELNEEEMKLAWDEFHNEEKASRQQADNISQQIHDMMNQFSNGHPMPGSSGMHVSSRPIPMPQGYNLNQTNWNPAPSASNQTHSNFIQPQNQHQPVPVHSQYNTNPMPSTLKHQITTPIQQFNNSNAKHRFVLNRPPPNVPKLTLDNRNGPSNKAQTIPNRRQSSGTPRPNPFTPSLLVNILNNMPINSPQTAYKRSQSVPGNNSSPTIRNVRHNSPNPLRSIQGTSHPNIPNNNSPNSSQSNNHNLKNFHRVNRNSMQNIHRNINHPNSMQITIPNPNDAITIPAAHSNQVSRFPPETTVNRQTPPPAHTANAYNRQPPKGYNPPTLPTAAANNASGTNTPNTTNNSYPDPFKQLASNIVVNPVAFQGKNPNISSPGLPTVANAMSPAVVNNHVPNRRLSAPERFKPPNVPSTTNTTHSNTAGKSKTVFDRSLPEFVQKENVIDYVNKLFETQNKNIATQPDPLKIVNVTTLSDNSTDIRDNFQPVGQNGATRTIFNKPTVQRGNSTARHTLIHNNFSTDVIQLD